MKKRNLVRFVIGVALSTSTALQAQQAVRFPPLGVTLPGNQFKYDTGFDLTDWNGDGQLDVLIPTGAMTTFHVYLNEGTKTEPIFRHGLLYD